MGSVDWSARPDQIEGLALREVTVLAHCCYLCLIFDERFFYLEIRAHLGTVL